MSSHPFNDPYSSEDMRRIVAAYEKKWVYQQLVGKRLDKLTIPQRFKFMVNLQKIHGLSAMAMIVFMLIDWPIAAVLSILVAVGLSKLYANAWTVWAGSQE
ncbi:MAG: hypothetical protein GJ680_15780 [Alteromonadaceae bacterium]|nr:hypothetical protein [Alteromonadaceae bacterium]